MRAGNRDPHVVLRRVGQAAVTGQQDLGIQSLQPLQRLDVIADAPGAEYAAHHTARHQRVGGKQQSLIMIEQADAGRGVARRVHHGKTEIAEVDQIAFLQPDVDIDRHARLVEHLAQHREVVAQHDLVGGQPMCGDEGAAVEMIGRADVVEVLVAQHHHVDIIGLHAEMVE